MIVGSLVSPPDPIAQMIVWPLAFACCLAVAYWVVRAKFGTLEAEVAGD